MDTPPPPPLFSPAAQPPPARRKGGKTWMIGLVVVAGLLVVVAILAALAVPKLKKYRDAAQAKKEEQLEAMKPRLPLTKEQKAAVEAFGRNLVAAVNEGTASKLGAAVDIKGLGDRVFLPMRDLPQMADTRRGFEKGFQSNPASLFTQILGQEARYMAQVERDGFPAVRMRVISQDGAINFLDVLVTVQEDGTVKAVDLFTFALGTYATAEARNAMMMLVNGEGGNPLMTALGMPQYDVKALQTMNDMRTAQRLGRHEQLISLYEGLTPALKKERIFFLVYMQGVMGLNLDEPENGKRYREVLDQAGPILGGESTPELLQIDIKFLDGDFAGAEEALRKVEAAVGEDAYLKHLRALMLLKQDKVEEASVLEREASKLEPELVNLVDLRLNIHLARKDYKAVIEEFRTFKAEHNVVLGREQLTEPQYADFLKSPEFAAWEAENR